MAGVNGIDGQAITAATPKRCGRMTSGPRGGYVETDGKRYSIRANVTSISGYSAHAEQVDLINFVGRMRRLPQEVRLVDGDGGAKARLRAALEMVAIRRSEPMVVTIGEPA